MFYWMIPFVSKWVLGNDYIAIPVLHQLELMFALKTGTFPLFIPGFAGGHSASALTLGQLFHPISHIVVNLPGYWNGKALEWNTLFRLISLGLAHLMIFRFLRRLNLESFKAFIISFITVYNLRMLDLFRYGASLESWTGHLFLCMALAEYYLHPTKVKGPLLIIGSTFWLVCSGHPQMMYYGLLGAGLFALAIPYFIEVIFQHRPADRHSTWKFWLRAFTLCGIGVLLSAAYIMPFYFDFLIWNTGRVSQSYLWADTYRDTLMGTFNNFFLPLRSDVNSGFGGSSLMLLGAIVPMLRLFRIKVPAVIWASWTLILLIFLHIQGSRTPVHYIFWKTLPFASSFRGPGRISMILPVFFMMVLVWLMGGGHKKHFIKGHRIGFYPYSLLALLALVLTAGYLWIPDSLLSDTAVYSATNIRNIPKWVENLALASGVAALIGLIFYGYSGRRINLIALFTGLFVCAQTIICLQFGTWVEQADTVKQTPSLAQIQAQKKSSLRFQYATGYGMANTVFTDHIQRSFQEPHIGRIYNRARRAKDRSEAYSLMEIARFPDQVILEKYKPTRSEGKPKRLDYEYQLSRTKMIYSSYNRLVFETQTFSSGYFGLAYPFTGNWVAFVNNVSVPVYRANGAEHAIELPAGNNLVEFRFWSPAAIWGMLLSLLMLLVMGIFVCYRMAWRPLFKIIAAVAVLIFCICGYYIWFQSLYNGDNLGTVYSWYEAPAPQFPNIAYGKRTNMSSHYCEDYRYYRSSGRAVDGVRSAESGFITGLENSPWWIVDLKQIKAIRAIHIYEDIKGQQVNRRPITVSFSSDGKNWRTVRVISEAASETPIRLEFSSSEKTRYVLLKAYGKCRLALNEVEIYSATKDYS